MSEVELVMEVFGGFGEGLSNRSVKINRSINDPRVLLSYHWFECGKMLVDIS